MQKQYSVEYVGAPNLPSGGLEYRFPKIGKVLAGSPRKIVYLTDERFTEARKLPGLEVKPGPVESAQQIEQRFRLLFGGIADAAKLSEADREATEAEFAKAIAKISKDEAGTGARLRNLVVSLASGQVAPGPPVERGAALEAMLAVALTSRSDVMGRVERPQDAWNAQDALTKLQDAAEAERLEALAGFALEIKKKAASHVASPLEELRQQITESIPNEIPELKSTETKTKTKKRGSS